VEKKEKKEKNNNNKNNNKRCLPFSKWLPKYGIKNGG
jgi:hypothetical protein